MGKKPTVLQKQTQEAARRRVQYVLDSRFDGNQSKLARALGVTHSLISMIMRGIQPPTENLMLRIGSLPGINPNWATRGRDLPVYHDEQLTVQVARSLIGGAPIDMSMMTREHIPVTRDLARDTCYFWRIPEGHVAAAVAKWRLLPGDLILVETNSVLFSSRAMIVGKHCIVDGSLLGLSKPLFGEVTEDSAGNVVFSDHEPRLLLDQPPTKEPGAPINKLARRRRTVRPLDSNQQEKQPARSFLDSLPLFGLKDVKGIQILMMRPTYPFDSRA